MGAASAIGPALSGVGSIMGGKGAAKAQGQATQAAQQAANAQSQLYGTESGAIDKLMQQYFGTTAPMENQLATQLSGALPGAMSGVGSTIGALQNFKGLKPEELQALISTLDTSGAGTIRSAMRQMGAGTANPNRMLQTLLTGNQQSGEQAGVQLGGLGAQQELGALQSSGDLGMSFLNALMGGQLDILGQESSLPGTSLGGLNAMAGGYGAAGANAAQTAAGYGNPWGTALSGLGTSLSSIFPGQSQSIYPGGGGMSTGFNQPGGFSAPLAPLPGPTPQTAAQLGWGQPAAAATPNPYLSAHW